ncbi:retinol dehydrogenase protein [Aspergillus terreus]|uniref:Retinol dehydrogenase protein n=1 Tax=Aspergillus terreus TaxID=33178 RepID=A0A5M3YQ19_ASPTE|nr:hypothetical protein ATETN484_0002072900 [Aspergillus terreus]GFF15585.1 retinol dehydrogenase protein [Aspergillus terreus]
MNHIDQYSPQSHISPGSSRLTSIDVWFALELMVAIDAFAIATTFNRTLINKWHYFASLRMMALSSIISFASYLRGVGDRTTVSISRHPVAVLGACGVHVLFGRALNHLPKPPPNTDANSYMSSLQTYSS